MAAYPHEETPLTEHEKAAYRYLLYQAMLDIRMLCQPRLSWNPLDWQQQYQSNFIAGRIADCLHNMAMYAAQDFRGFDAVWFWRGYDIIFRKFTDFSNGSWFDYRRRYNDHLARLKKEQKSA